MTVFSSSSALAVPPYGDNSFKHQLPASPADDGILERLTPRAASLRHKFFFACAHSKVRVDLGVRDSGGLKV
jgi:hypothetical protein